MMNYKKVHNNTVRVVWVIFAVLWMALIFRFSGQRAETSSQLSGSLSYRIMEQADSLFSAGWTKENLLYYAGIFEHPLRKAAHMAEYAILAIFLLGNYSGYQKTYKKRYILAGMSSALYAATDEIHQLFVEGRSGQFTDVCIDSIGAVLGLCAVFFILMFYDRMFHRKIDREKKEVTDNGRT